MPRPVPGLALVVAGYVGMVLALVAAGEAIVHWDVLAGLRAWDDDVCRWLADRRTGLADDVTGFLSRAADTMGVIVCALLVEIVLALRRRWWALLVMPIGLGLELGDVPHCQRRRRSTEAVGAQARVRAEHLELPVRAHRSDRRAVGSGRTVVRAEVGAVRGVPWAGRSCSPSPSPSARPACIAACTTRPMSPPAC